MSQLQQTPAPQGQNATTDFDFEQLQSYRGRWVAFSADGRRLIASSPTLAALDAQVRAAGENPEEVLLERIPDAATVASGSELT